MALVLTSGPASEPVTVAEAKAHLRIDQAQEDVLIASLILTSRLHIEAALGLALIDQRWRLSIDRWPRHGVLEVPIGPLNAVTAIGVRDAAGGVTIMPAARYLVDLSSKPARIAWNAPLLPKPGVEIGGIEIDLDVGFGADGASVPAPLKHAILMLVAHWYEHRDPIEIGSASARIPDAVSDLIQPFRKMRL